MLKGGEEVEGNKERMKMMKDIIVNGMVMEMMEKGNENIDSVFF